MAEIIKLFKQTSLLGDNETGGRKFRSYAEMFKSEQVSDDAKLRQIETWLGFVTHNSVTKADLIEALRWLVSVTCE
jgi:hypothetical protein